MSTSVTIGDEGSECGIWPLVEPKGRWPDEDFSESDPDDEAGGHDIWGAGICNTGGTARGNIVEVSGGNVPWK